jgi:hypothetical protein
MIRVSLFFGRTGSSIIESRQFVRHEQALGPTEQATSATGGTGEGIIHS